jgi:nitrate/nitrite transporter NarK
MQQILVLTILPIFSVALARVPTSPITMIVSNNL